MYTVIAEEYREYYVSWSGGIMFSIFHKLAIKSRPNELQLELSVLQMDLWAKYAA